MKIEIKYGVEIDPMEDGMYPLCYVGKDEFDGKDYWIVTDSDNWSVAAQADYIVSIFTENDRLRELLAQEKSRTNMLNFGQVAK